ncbi:MAG TPA: hypothetical protein EYP25_03530 [Anaerolineae bacterium]|nr:hypothetical protein [Anaerolineae bacterium]
MSGLSIITFYAGLIFGFGFGLIAVYRIGRIGWTQFWYWAAGVGASRSLGHMFAYWSTIFGPLLGQIWIFIGIPAFVLDLILTLMGYEYYPFWLDEIGLVSTGRRVAVLLGGYVFAYVLGRLNESRQSEFNRARILYERVVTRKGYWFDHRDDPGYYDGPDAQPALKQAEMIYRKILNDLEQWQGPKFMAKQNLIILHYQRALLYCSLGEFSTAKDAVTRARELKAKIPPSDWERDEERTLESQLLFLEGEIAFVEGRRDDARKCFQASREIDKSLGDSTGVQKNDERLVLVR